MPTNEQIATAFNAGYTMQQHHPELVENLLSTDNDNEIVQSMTQGAKQWQKERIAQKQQHLKEKNEIKTKRR